MFLLIKQSQLKGEKNTPMLYCVDQVFSPLKNFDLGYVEIWRCIKYSSFVCNK